MDKTFVINGVRFYDIPVEKLNLTSKEIKRLTERGVMTAAAVQQLSPREKDLICRKEDGSIDYRFELKLSRCLNTSEYVEVETGTKYRPNDDWEIFVGDTRFSDDGHIGYCYNIRRQEAEHVMSYDQYIALMKKLHRDFPKLNDMELMRKLERSTVAEPYIRSMIIKELSICPASYEKLRQYAILFSSSDIFKDILCDMLTKHEIDSYVPPYYNDINPNTLYIGNYGPFFAIAGCQHASLSSFKKVDFG